MAKPQFNHAMTYLSTPCGNHTITQSHLPRTQTSLSRAQRKVGRRQRRDGAWPSVCTLPMVPCGSSPVARFYLAKKEAPEEDTAITHFRGTAYPQPRIIFLTFNISEISSNNSEKLSLLANKHLWTFLLHSSYSSSGCRVTRSAGTTLALFSHQKKTKSSKSAILLSPNSFDS